MAWSLAIALFILPTYASGLVAKRRGRNVRTWYWIGALFGPFALIAVSLLPSSKQAAQHA